MLLRSTVVASMGSLVFAAFSAAQTTTSMGTGSGGSPHERTTWTIKGATISIEYGRPYLKGRAEEQLMPAGQPWRTGADAATVITTNKALTFGTVTLSPGSYTINTEPGAKSWQILLGKLGAPGQWGIPHLPKLELGRESMTLTRVATPVEQVTISILTSASGTTLRVAWGTVAADAPFKIAQ